MTGDEDMIGDEEDDGGTVTEGDELVLPLDDSALDEPGAEEESGKADDDDGRVKADDDDGARVIDEEDMEGGAITGLLAPQVRCVYTTATWSHHSPTSCSEYSTAGPSAAQ